MRIFFHNEIDVITPPGNKDSIHFYNQSSVSGETYCSGFEVRYIHSGTLETIVNNRKFTLTNGDLILILPGSEITTTSKGMFNGISIIKEDDHNIWPLEIERSAELKETLIDFYQINKKESIPKLRNYLSRLMLHPASIDTAEVIKTIDSLIYLNVFKYYNKVLRIGRKKISTQLNILKRIESVGAEIRKNCTLRFDLNDIATKSLMSKYELIRQFKNVFGITPHQYYVRHKTNIAKDLLAEGMPVKNVAQLCGYPDIYSFSKQFKVEVGFAPSMFKSSLPY